MTELARFAVMFAALGCTCIAVVITLHPKYHCGFVRVVGLGMIAVAGLSRAAKLWLDPDAVVTHVGVLLWIGLFLFLGSHAWRFFSRYRRGGPCWYDQQSEPDGRPVVSR